MGVSIVLNTSDIRGNMKHFWRSTGFCPPQPHQHSGSFDLSDDMVQNLAYIGALPFRGITQVRVHWLLDLIKVSKITSLKSPEYNFSLLDSLVKLMFQNNLAFGFELMGNPSDLFSDFENKTQVFWFRDLVNVIGTRYIEMYGLSYVKEWNFETWNEPDCHDFDRMKFTVQGFLNYYDACSEGLKAAHPSLVLGGPGDACWPDPVTGKVTRSRVLFDALLNHTVRGINFFTGEKGIRLDFISLHEKGDGKGFNILEKEISASKYLNQKFPELANKPFYNDEADPLVGWSRPKEWRASVEYAALIAKVIVQHQNILPMQKTYLRNYALLSNDNAFLSYYPNQFTQRTLLARFQINSTSATEAIKEGGKIINAELDQQRYVTFVRKPAYILMGMLALLGEKQIFLNISIKENQSWSNSSSLGMLGTIHEPKDIAHTSDSWQVTMLMYGASDPGDNKTMANVDLRWYLDPPEHVSGLKLMVYMIWYDWGDPYIMWKILFNSAKYPTLAQFAKLREAENPAGLLVDVPVAKGFAPIPRIIQLMNPHVMLLHLCAKPTVAPEKVTDVRLINITAGQVMVVWSDKNIFTKCILTYSVEWSPSSSKDTFKRLNKYNIVVNLFVHETDSEEKVKGFYRVRAIDYWGQKGSVSDAVPYK
ncbi:alpha-l-iduronidase [Plakobranchus ocellatus]|uniref:Alpha-l-iduronidase n=1 Tax=Plakobranchus ocellatus TaxID=259542 RepID=A0AAV3YEZ7_9GAST|nr:alpha-l-iduronidase [Plakobranchus ocellatus]